MIRVDTNVLYALGFLPASLCRFIGNNAYDATALRTDLARFQFLLGGNESSSEATSNPTSAPPTHA